MADYFPVISRAVAGLNPNTGEARRAVYERARTAIVRQLKGIEPPLPEEDIAREQSNLEEAIRRVEAEAAAKEPAAARPAPQPAAPRPAPQPGPDAAKPAPTAVPPRPAPDQPAARRPAPAPANEAKPAQGPGAGADRRQDQRAGKGAGGGGGGKGKGGAGRPATRADGRPIVRSAGGAGQQKKGGRSGLVIALCALAVIAVGAGLFAARSQIAALLPGGSDKTEVASTDPKPSGDKPADDGKAADPSASTPDGAKPADAKSDDRLPQDQAGGETPPPAAEQPAPAAPPAEQQEARGPDATAPQPDQAPPAAQPPASDTPSGQSGPLVAQRAVLYEEGPNQQSGEALSGTIVWRTESVAAGQNRPLETALKGEIDIPGRNLRAVLTIRRNIDATLPASHTIEIQFTLPSDFPNAGVTNVPGVLMKTDESARGSAVAGLSVKVTNGFFLIGLSNVDSEKSVNEQLLRDRGWIDIPILYENGRRAVLTLEKGTPGKQAFDQAFDAWKTASAANPQPR